jgi:hypothetical protein
MSKETSKTNIRSFITLLSLSEKFQEQINLALAAYADRDMETVGGVGAFLIDSGSPAYAPIGKYLAGVSLIGEGNGDLERAKALLLEASDSCQGKFKDRSLVSLSTVFIHTGDYTTAAKICEQLKQSKDSYSFIEAHISLASIRGYEGQSHKASLAYQDLYQVINRVDRSLTFLKYWFANNWAVELAEIGQVTEALRLSRFAISAPFVHRAKIFADTHQAITEKQSTKPTVSVPDTRGLYRSKLIDWAYRSKTTAGQLMKVWNYAEATR